MESEAVDALPDSVGSPLIQHDKRIRRDDVQETAEVELQHDIPKELAILKRSRRNDIEGVQPSGFEARIVSVLAGAAN